MAQSLKAALAGVLSWLVAHAWLDSSMAIIAPWVAVVLVQTTIYQSISTGLRQLVAIAGGSVFASLALVVVDDTAVAMCIVLPVTLLLAWWYRFGDQGIYAATTALFVVVYGTGSPLALVERLRDAMIGGVIAIVVNIVILPPLYQRRSREAVQRVLREAGSILSEAADGLRENAGAEQAASWYGRAFDLNQMMQTVHTTLRADQESLRLNPARYRFARSRSAGTEGGRPGTADPATVFAQSLGTLVRHTVAIIGVLGDAAASDTDRQLPDHGFAREYADLLDDLATACDAHADLATNQADTDSQEAFDRSTQRAAVQVTRIRDEMRSWSDHPADVYGSLLLEARRMLDSLDEAGSMV